MFSVDDLVVVVGRFLICSIKEVTVIFGVEVRLESSGSFGQGKGIISIS